MLTRESGQGETTGQNFGSTGSRASCRDCSSSGGGGAAAEALKRSPPHVDHRADDDDDEEEEEEEEEEVEEEEEEEDDDDDVPPVASSSRLGAHLDDRPNAFFCVSLHSPSVLRAVADAQAAIVAADPRLGAVATSTTGTPALTPLSALHVTLGTARIQTSCERSAAARWRRRRRRRCNGWCRLATRCACAASAFRDHVAVRVVQGLSVAAAPAATSATNTVASTVKTLRLPPAPATVLYAAISGGGDGGRRGARLAAGYGSRAFTPHATACCRARSAARWQPRPFPLWGCATCASASSPSAACICAGCASRADCRRRHRAPRLYEVLLSSRLGRLAAGRRQHASTSRRRGGGEAGAEELHIFDDGTLFRTVDPEDGPPCTSG